MTSQPLIRCLPRTVAVLAGIGLCALVLTAAAEEQQPVASSDVAIIVHLDNELADLTFGELRALFDLKRRFWPDGKPVQVVLPGRRLAERTVLLDKVYGMSPEQLANRWRQRIFAGEITTVPTGSPSREALLETVQSNAEAIAAISAAAVSGKVRVIKVDGKLPGEPGYPLR